MENCNKSVLLILTALILGGCVTSTPDSLFATNEPLGHAKIEGQFPKIGQVPVGQTSQITPTEKIITKRQLAQAAAQGRAQASQDAQGQYSSEVARMRKEAAESRKKLLQDIENNNRVEQPQE